VPGATAARGAADGILRALGLVTCVWTALLVPALVRESHRAATAIAVYAAALVPVLASGESLEGARRASSWGLAALGVLGGFLGYPAWIALSVALGIALGLPEGGPVPRWAGSPSSWVVVLLGAPVLEEALYRDRLLPAVAKGLGPGAGIFLSAALFSAPHLEPWAVLVTFELGLVLGMLRLGARSLAPCIGLHAGLNAASVVFGVPGTDLHPLSPVEGALLGSTLPCGAALLARRRAPPRPAGRLCPRSPRC
jgi:membrane protease YdiL (CAAX protease family)